MNAVRLGDSHWDLDEVVGRAEAGETVEIMRGERVVAKVVPVETGAVIAPKKLMTPDEWKAFLREIEEFASTLKYDPTNSVEEMRKQARY
ncbi:type II toxin-antitoxin system Phd/YefM family antitoxin [Sphingomonas lenta]|uniref:Type II toxin-antitoxin system prevent-host-death family antitoxin n=1 Tax=Sphingomonas lenta TaxID=1141887 RepID=A0A2A2SE85_9SPHN|nr:hypothetical protein [Sphingomonas lenta]PAX07604.1 hypothetical protein CKY28_08095 [Sphingomonas lenta]